MGLGRKLMQYRRHEIVNVWIRLLAGCDRDKWKIRGLFSRRENLQSLMTDQGAEGKRYQERLRFLVSDE